jgi:hypothetical protein
MRLMTFASLGVRLNWADKIDLYVALAVFVGLVFVGSVLLAVAGHAPRGHLAFYLLIWGLKCEALITLPIWLLLQAIRATFLLGRRAVAYIASGASAEPRIRSAVPELVPLPTLPVSAAALKG